MVLLGLGIWGLIRSLTVPTDINLVASDVAIDDGGVVHKPRIIDENGCYYQPIQCVKAPCEPIKVCPTTTANTPIPRGCTSWFDGCNTCRVNNGVITGCTKMACKLDPNSAPKPYCKAYGEDVPVPSPTPVPSPVICTQDVYTCSDGSTVRRSGSKCEFVCPSVAPTSTPQQILITLVNFNASTPCGALHFKNYQFTCSLGPKHIINDNTCISVDEAMKRAKSLCQTNPK